MLDDQEQAQQLQLRALITLRHLTANLLQTVDFMLVLEGHASAVQGSSILLTEWSTFRTMPFSRLGPLLEQLRRAQQTMTQVHDILEATIDEGAP